MKPAKCRPPASSFLGAAALVFKGQISRIVTNVLDLILGLIFACKACSSPVPSWLRCCSNASSALPQASSLSFVISSSRLQLCGTYPRAAFAPLPPPRPRFCGSAAQRELRATGIACGVWCVTVCQVVSLEEPRVGSKDWSVVQARVFVSCLKSV